MESPLLLPQLLIQVFDWFDREMLARMSLRGWPQLSRSQSMVMAYVDPHGIRLSEIARRQFVSRQAIHRIVTDLRDLGLLELRVDAQNKSAKLVVATERGNRCIADAKRIFSELEDELANAIGRDEVESLREKLISARNATRHPTPSPAKNYVAGGVDL